MEALTEPSPASPSPTAPVEEKLRGVLGAMTEAVDAILGTTEIDRFGRAARLCVMGQKISGELVKTIKEAKKIRAIDNRGAAIDGLMGPEAQYIGQGGGDIDGYAEDMADHDILQGRDLAMPRMVGGFGGDQVELQRNMLMLVQEWFADQKKIKDAQANPINLPPSNYAVYSEMSELLRVRALLQDPKDAVLLAKVEKQIDQYVDLFAKGKEDDPPAPDTTHVVSTELLRGHPPGAGEQWGDAADPRRPVLHREDRGEGADLGGEALGDLEEAVG